MSLFQKHKGAHEVKQTNLNEKLVEMPELTHKDYDGTFDIKKSKAVAWMINQEVVMQYIWDKAVERKCIIFDCEKGTWKGVGNGFFDSEKQIMLDLPSKNLKINPNNKFLEQLMGMNVVNYKLN